MELNYQELLDKAKDINFVTKVTCCSMNDYDSFHSLSKEQVYDLLKHPIWKTVFSTIFIADMELFYHCFEEDSLEILCSLKNNDLLEAFLTFTINSYDAYNEKVISFLQNDDLLQEWLIDKDLLQNLLYYNCYFGMNATNGISKNTLHHHFEEILFYLADYFPLKLESFIDDVKKDDICYALLEQNYRKYFLSFQRGQGSALISFINAIKCIKDANKVIEEEKDYIIDTLFSSDVLILEDESYHESLKLLLKEILEIENANIFDIKYIDSGSFSDVYRIKDLVLKVGAPRSNYEIPTHRLILKPFFRRYLYELGITVEVAQYVEVVHDEEISKQVFFSLMDDEIVWADPRGDNVGKIVPLENTNLEKLPKFISNQSIGFLGNAFEKIEDGSYVILDTDFLMTKEKFEEQDYVSPSMMKYLEEYKAQRKK